DTSRPRSEGSTVRAGRAGGNRAAACSPRDTPANPRAMRTPDNRGREGGSRRSSTRASAIARVGRRSRRSRSPFLPSSQHLSDYQIEAEKDVDRDERLAVLTEALRHGPAAAREPANVAQARHQRGRRRGPRFPLGAEQAMQLPILVLDLRRVVEPEEKGRERQRPPVAVG